MDIDTHGTYLEDARLYGFADRNNFRIVVRRSRMLAHSISGFCAAISSGCQGGAKLPDTVSGELKISRLRRMLL